MTTYVYHNGRVIDKVKAPAKYFAGKAAYVISDEMPTTWHPGNGKRYSSKAKFRQATRDAGCIEVGNDPAILGKPRAPVAFNPQVRRQEIRESIRRQLHREHA